MFKKGYKQTEEHKRKIGEANKIALKGRHSSPATEFKKGVSHFKGILCSTYIDGRTLKPKFCIDCGKKIWYSSNRCRKCYHNSRKAENSNWYINGKSLEIYPLEFNKELKETIRKRDNYTCQICGKSAKDNGRALDVHHIDYNKQNLNPNNLISLCISCHMKTNYNRDIYIEYFEILRGE